MSPFKAIIVDDERLARRELSKLLSVYPFIHIIGEADSVNSAIKIISEGKPDVLFLDIQMPGETGFDLLEKINVDFHVVFVTAYDKYAIKAFEINAEDYLLKPVVPERLKKTVERICSIEGSLEPGDFKLDYDDCMFLNIDKFLKVIKVSSIISINSNGDYTTVLLSNGTKGLVLRSMKDWEKKLPAKHFIRIHRCTIINVNYIERIEQWFNSSFRLFFINTDEPVNVSRRYSKAIKNRFK